MIESMSRWGWGALILIALLGCDEPGNGKGAPAGSAKPKIAKRCSPDHEMTEEERYQLQVEIDEGKDPCPGWGAPRLVLDAQGVTLNTERIEGGSYATGNVLYIGPLHDKLKTNRETWKSFHPNKPFPGKLSMVAEPGVGVEVGASVMATAALAGYPDFTVEAGKVAVQLRWPIPGPPGPGPRGPEDEVLLEPLAPKGFQVGLRGLRQGHSSWSPWVRSRAKPADEGELKKWFEDNCAEDETAPPVELIRLRALDGPLVDALRPLRTVLALPVFSKRQPAVQLTFQCEPPSDFLGRPGAAPPWGPRFPQTDYPCHLPAAPEPSAANPRTRFGKATIEGSLPLVVVQRIIRQAFGRFRLCYEMGLRNDPKLEGRVVVLFEIAEDGTVKDPLGGGDMPDKGVTSCVIRALHSLTFPPPEDGTVTVTYPIVFTPGE